MNRLIAGDRCGRTAVRLCFSVMQWTCVSLVALSAAIAQAELPQLKVSANQRHLEIANDQPFFFLGDTAWELFHRLTYEEADEYLQNRKEKGFNVVQAVALAEFDGLTQPNSNGDLPLVNQDPTQPVEAYFQHVDRVIARANELGLYVGLLPTWGDKWVRRWGVGPEVFTPDNAFAFGEFMGRRYKNAGIIWILGGDRNPDNDTHKAIIDSMAKGVRAGDGGAHLCTYHPQGGSSSAQFFHDEPWLDFNTFQSGHGKDGLNFYWTVEGRKRLPTKPILDSEPNYEDHPIGFDPKQGYFDAFPVRRAMYWSVLAGAAGHTYGNHNIWQFLSDKNQPVSWARTPWRTAIDHPGAFQVGYARKFFETHGWTTLNPTPDLLTQQPGGVATQMASRAADGRKALIYTPTGESISVDTCKINGASVNSSWFNPETNESSASKTIENAAQRYEFHPPAGPPRDWVLVLDGVD